jgi:ferritin
MITKALNKAINEQIKREEQSSRIYLSMASWCQVNGYQGAADYLYAQVEEERMHENKFIHYLNDRGGHAVLSDVEKPVEKFKSIMDVFQQVLKHEEYITASINELYGLTVSEKDYTTGNFMQWFITEQIEEETTVRTIIDKLNLAGPEKGGLFMIDKELGTMAAAKRAAQIALLSAKTVA